jgi:hypothetical protein
MASKSTALRLGELNTLCRVERKENDLGLGIPPKYQPSGKTAWCSVEQLGGIELMVAQQINARANVRLKTHWQDGIRPGDRLVSIAPAGRTFNIVAANNNLNQFRELWLTCIEVVDG